ncbi:MAG: 16S rRNA (cytosine(967)-C(5))-methyltransferase RsmB [Azonexus sp.]|nr:16S rRNA (cytosine(967)-C(5))-methyltransferase RsmB [Betaproteobacteria bacterium]MBK8919672.1 16S rRNA (cytosine(967)-C(5))-methyltransferase RsmB [Betaproteobacteria bacterium]MBP6034914.1 16S rRNA (cytosine(967)-C(5))-methyltransferase RsmB [Azonexus sp.]MBP6905620.1 16S rRNA (cytosine(967)-C(5))-methyltransferase RsmB [Azonexus sp.]
MSPRSPAVPALEPNSLAYGLHAAARVVAEVLAGRSLAEGLPAWIDAGARPAVQDFVYSSLRQYGRGDFLLGRLLDRPLAEEEVRALLLMALHRLESRPESAHTTVDQAVNAAGALAGGRRKALVNAVLRSFQREREALLAAADADDTATGRHPPWWLDRLRQAYPEKWESVVVAGNRPPPMALRVNLRRGTVAAYAAELLARDIVSRPWGEAGLILDKPVPVERLPHFAAGRASVQDPGAQRAAALLDPAPGSRVLDACAAPGGKAAHLLERADLDLLALDLKPARCRRVESTLARLGLRARVQVADAARPEAWWDGLPFDAVLADVPCTASGVVRRHPDAKWLRRESDVARFAATQAHLLDALWRVVKPGGKLLYATCSIFPEENGAQVEAFLARQASARRGHEEQWLPCDDHDGFYYCLLEKLP